MPGSHAQGRCGAHKPGRRDEQQQLTEGTMLDSIRTGVFDGVRDKKIRRIDKTK